MLYYSTPSDLLAYNEMVRNKLNSKATYDDKMSSGFSLF